MPRRLLNLLTALSLLLCVAVAALWVRSHDVRDVLSRERASIALLDVHRLTLGTVCGGLQFESYRLATRLYPDPDLHRLGPADYRRTVEPARTKPDWTKPPKMIRFCGTRATDAATVPPWSAAPPLATVTDTAVTGPYVNDLRGITLPYWLLLAAACALPLGRATTRTFFSLARCPRLLNRLAAMSLLLGAAVSVLWALSYRMSHAPAFETSTGELISRNGRLVVTSVPRVARSREAHARGMVARLKNDDVAFVLFPDGKASAVVWGPGQEVTTLPPEDCRRSLVRELANPRRFAAAHVILAAEQSSPPFVSGIHVENGSAVVEGLRVSLLDPSRTSEGQARIYDRPGAWHADRAQIPALVRQWKSRLAQPLIEIPYAAIAGTTLAIPAAWIGATLLRVRQLRRAGLCPTCAYDLRATAERCPECGTPGLVAATA